VAMWPHYKPWRLAAPGLVLAAGLLAACSSSSGAGASPSTAHPVPRGQDRTHTADASRGTIPVIPCDASSVPRRMKLPSGVTLPPGAAAYATTQPGISSVTLSIALAGYTCTALEGGDGSFVISFTAPGAKAPAISYDYSPGGAMINLQSVCAYFPALKALDAQANGGQAICALRPRGEVVRRITTGDPHVLAATTVNLPGTLPASADPSHGRAESVGVIVASTGAGQTAGCILPASQRRVCVAGLRLFAAQSIAARSGAARVAAIQSAIGKL
jgi:hypothetical protein